MIYVKSFIFCGLLCSIGQIILDNTKLTTGHITSLFVVMGSFLDAFNIYDKFIDIFGAGALVPITSFGHSLVHGALARASDNGILGLFTGMFDLSSAGMISAIVFSFIFSLIFKPKN